MYVLETLTGRVIEARRYLNRIPGLRAAIAIIISTRQSGWRPGLKAGSGPSGPWRKWRRQSFRR